MADERDLRGLTAATPPRSLGDRGCCCCWCGGRSGSVSSRGDDDELVSGGGGGGNAGAISFGVDDLGVAIIVVSLNERQRANQIHQTEK